MKSLRNLMIAASLLALCACSSTRSGTGGDRETGEQKVDCSTVRCASCPEGQRPALRPPDCCRCIPE